MSSSAEHRSLPSYCTGSCLVNGFIMAFCFHRDLLPIFLNSDASHCRETWLDWQVLLHSCRLSAAIRKSIKGCSVLEADVRLFLLTKLTSPLILTQVSTLISSHFLLWTPEVCISSCSPVACCWNYLGSHSLTCLSTLLHSLLNTKH
ncbi:hypothetical protein ATANTOWER_014478 [Ataeniobius toweri]|uniref:Uncharacterized protein n=1 Tax=Ataeniobius toweri TaxID=208326 RepID=A0ABU7B046_9TELE|nr:hypothetical protein [Ataeniobius toweri]